MDPARKALDDLIRGQKGCTYSGLSRLLGRNVSYIQQYITKGSPRFLEDGDRIILARFFGVKDSVLGVPPHKEDPAGNLVPVPVLDVEASAGHGALAEAERKCSQIAFEANWLKKLTPSKASNLSIIRVLGDSMEPTLNDGDEAMVDLGDGQSHLRDGIYVLRMDETLSVKRIALEPQSDRISVLSDNPAYPSWPGLKRRSVGIVGRVLWFGRKLQ